MTTKPRAKTRQENLQLLNAFEDTPSTSRNILISTVKQQYITGYIRTYKEAATLIKLVQSNKMDDFDVSYNQIKETANVRLTKHLLKESKRREIEDKLPTTEKNFTRYILSVKNKTSELPTFELKFKILYTNIDAAWKSGVLRLIKTAESRIEEKQNLKIVVGVEVVIAKLEDDEIIRATIYVPTEPESVYNKEEIAPLIRSKKSVLKARLINIIERQEGSGWTVEKITGLFLTTYTQKPSRGSSYIPTPEALRNPKLGLINIQNNDNECFKYCLLYHQSEKKKHGERLSVLKKITDKYKWKGVNFPTTFNDITTFENNNKVCINIYGYNNQEINPIRLGTISYIKNDNINLLLIKNEEDKGREARSSDSCNGHYIYIKKVESLLCTVKNSQYKDRSYCPYCRKVIPTGEIYEDHVKSKHYDCHNNCNLELPEEGATMKFKNYKNMLERPFIVYADFEASLIPTEMSDKIACHEPNSACAYFVCTFDNSRNKLYTFEGKDCVINMIAQLKLLGSRCVKEQKENERMIMTDEDEINFKNAERCYICDGSFSKANYKVKDHYHRTGNYRGAAHNACNINYFTNRYLPIVFHNLRGYDSHLIIKKAFDVVGADKINAIPNSGEKFMTFTIGELKFIDSCQFMASSLDKLTESLKTPGNDPYSKFHNMKNNFNKEQMKLICQKGFYPYEFIDSHEKLYYEGLPPKDKFYSKLRLEGISDEDYNHAQNVYKSFNCKSFKDYHFLYLKCDVLLLSDIFENFRKMCIEYYRLDPANYLTSASLAWDSMLLKTKVELELITDPEILTMIEKAKRGGLTFVGSKRHVKANNKYMGDSFNPKKENSYISYIDANNLYGCSMSEPLPFKNIKFEKSIDLKTILETSDDNETGYFVEADLDFPPELHDKFKMFPPCPEPLVPNVDDFSDYQKELMEITKSKANYEKLIPHLKKHTNYVLHYRNLKFIHELGVKVEIKRVISFKQKAWMKEYIHGNNQLRTVAKNNKDNFLADLFKLLNNSCFGKTLEQVRDRMKMHLTIDRNNAIKYFSKLEFKTATFIDGLYLIQEHKTKVVYDRPCYVGCAVLDLSKLHMLKFHYNIIEKNLKGKYDLIYSDTDSLVYHIRHQNFYKWQHENSDEFDLSNLTGKFKKDDNNNILGKFKNETGSKVITEFLALSPKSYSYKYCEKEVKKAKGVAFPVSEKTMSFNDYHRVLDSNQGQTRPIYSIRSFNQTIYTYVEDKIVLTSWYDKMCLLDSVNCQPFGYNPI